MSRSKRQEARSKSEGPRRGSKKQEAGLRLLEKPEAGSRSEGGAKRVAGLSGLTDANGRFSNTTYVECSSIPRPKPDWQTSRLPFDRTSGSQGSALDASGCLDPSMRIPYISVFLPIIKG
jgi:hypothetical protein